MHTLRVCVWNKNWLGKKSFLGEVRLPLSVLDLTNSTKHWYSLEEKVLMTINTLNFQVIMKNSVFKARMTPPLLMSKFTLFWCQANSMVERKAVWNAAYRDQGHF